MLSSVPITELLDELSRRAGAQNQILIVFACSLVEGNQGALHTRFNGDSAVLRVHLARLHDYIADKDNRAFQQNARLL